MEAHDMMSVPKPPAPENVDQMTDVGKAAYRLIKDVAPAAVGPGVAVYAANVELINATLATVSGLLGIAYLVVKIWLAIKHRHQRAPE